MAIEGILVLIFFVVLTDTGAEVHEEEDSARRGACVAVLPSVKGHLISLRTARAL